MQKIVIEDAETRAAIQAGLWREAVNVLDPGDTPSEFAESAWWAAMQLIDGVESDGAGRFDARLAELAAIRADINKVATSPLGSELELASPPRVSAGRPWGQGRAGRGVLGAGASDARPDHENA